MGLCRIKDDIVRATFVGSCASVGEPCALRTNATNPGPSSTGKSASLGVCSHTSPRDTVKASVLRRSACKSLDGVIPADCTQEQFCRN
jgi:hypothetical protein